MMIITTLITVIIINITSITVPFIIITSLQDKHYRMAPQNSVGTTNIDPNSSGPYTPAKEKDGRVIREETIEQVYRISGTGHAPKFDPNDMVTPIVTILTLIVCFSPCLQLSKSVNNKQIKYRESRWWKLVSL